jgi:transcriptional regulator with XRE-family HTH domain
MPLLPSTLSEVPDEELFELMNRLRQWADEKHGRQKEIAAEMDVTEETVSRWLRHRKKPSLEKFFKLREFLQKQIGS